MLTNIRGITDIAVATDEHEGVGRAAASDGHKGIGGAATLDRHTINAASARAITAAII